MWVYHLAREPTRFWELRGYGVLAPSESPQFAVELWRVLPEKFTRLPDDNCFERYGD